MDIGNHSNTNVATWQLLLRQIYVCSSAWTIFFVTGLCLGTSTVAIPQLRKEANSTTAVSNEMASWISSVTGFTAIIWTVVLAALLNCFGYKKILMALAVNNIGGFTLLCFSNKAVHLLIYHIVFGMSYASCLTVSILIITEYSAPQYRGLFLSLKSATTFWGIWVANAIGAFTDFRNIGLLGICCSIYVIMSLFIIPESPLWLAKKVRYEECAKSHRWLKGEDENMEKELKFIIDAQRNHNNFIQKNSLRAEISITMHHIIKPEMYKPFFISTLLTFMYYGSGKLVFTIYSIEILKNITKSDSAAITGMLVLDGVAIAGMYLGSGLSKMLKRRTLTLTTSLIATLFLYSSSFYLYLVKYNLLIQNSFITLILLTGFSLAISSGPMVMLYAVHAEIIPVISRSFYSALVGCLTFFSVGLTLKVSPFLFRSFGHEGAFLCFALFSSLIFILVYIYLPETKDKTLQEISELFKKKKSVAGLDSTELKLLSKNITIT